MESTESPLVSIVIAFLNEERFLSEAVDSVLEQRYTNWELVLVDDGSTDQSTRIAQEYATRFPNKIRYTEHEGHANKGLSASRNHGIQQGTGPLLGILDADDVWRPEKLLEQVAIYTQYPEVAMIAEASLYWYSWAPATRADQLIPVGAPPDKLYRPTELLFHLYPFSEGAAPCPSGLLITRKAFLAVGGFEESFRGRYQLYEDQAFLNKVYLQENVYVSSACNNWYRQRTGSIVQSVTASGQYHQVRQYFLEWFRTYLQAKAFSNKRVSALVAKALFQYHHPKQFTAKRRFLSLAERAARLIKKVSRKPYSLLLRR